ncbi:MAG: response regulator [Leptolyngbyaceae cyanobacterium bins.302]|nr:response regulator [Leptolyngbyaceae cyanobacterium bins.302]
MSINQSLIKDTAIDKTIPGDLNPQSSPIRILLVDDNPTNLKVLSDALQGQGWRTLVATDGESAIEQAEYAHPDIILLDIMMPTLDGFETCQKLKSISATRDIPIIFMTALSDSANKVKGLELGAVDYITKPFQQEEVIARIKLQVKLFQLTQTLETQNLLLQNQILEQAKTEAELQKLTEELEQRVQARTSELTDSLDQLRMTQLQLIQSEKMSALGNLVAGVAHEINNPVGFISGNLQPALNYVQDIFGLLDLYQQECPTSSAAIQEEIEAIDLDYVREDLPKLIHSMQLGVDRIRDISTSLRTFSRADKDYKVPFNIHDGIDSTILILKHRLKGSDGRSTIEVVTDYETLPQIDCFPGQLNQVFMNILANAIDAVEESRQKYNAIDKKINAGRIEIKTHLDEYKKQVIIQIRDNGIGMTDEVRQQVFDHLFTTKAVGKGTGLGLAIVQQIVVEKHNGTVQVDSQPEAGTCFTITLPIKSST